MVLCITVQCNKDLPDGHCTVGVSRSVFVFQDQSAPSFYLQTTCDTPKEKQGYNNSIISHTTGKIPSAGLLTFQSTTH